jgi:hypothetical protein
MKRRAARTRKNKITPKTIKIKTRKRRKLYLKRKKM